MAAVAVVAAVVAVVAVIAVIVVVVAIGRSLGIKGKRSDKTIAAMHC